MSDVGDAAPIEVAAGVGQGAWAYAWAHRRKPHVHPLTTPSGRVLTQVEPPDHPWQRGVWFVVKYVDGDNFWEEYDPAGWGVQRHRARPAVTGPGADAGAGGAPTGPGDVASTGPGSLAGTVVEGDLAWVRPDRTTEAVHEHRRVSSTPLGDDAFALDWDVTLRVPADATLDRTPFNGTWGGYSGLAFRGRADWHDTRLLLDDGVARDRVAPQRSRWCDLSGPVDPAGPAIAGAGGVCVLDHPSNPAHPVPFYATCRAGAGYGEGWANTVYPAFLWDGPLVLPADEPLRFRYRLVVHDGVWTADRAEAAWQHYAAGP